MQFASTCVILEFCFWNFELHFHSIALSQFRVLKGPKPTPCPPREFHFIDAQVQVVLRILLYAIPVCWSPFLPQYAIALLGMWRLFLALSFVEYVPYVTTCIWPPTTPPPQAASAWETTIASAQRGDRVIWEVNCNGPCRDIKAKLRTSSGDADLYMNENEHPTLTGYECPSCSMCEAVSGSQDDKCSTVSISGDGLIVNYG